MIRITPAHRALFFEFLRFGVVGVIGFLVDNAVVYSTLGVIGVYWAGALAYPVASTGNWFLNRIWTFKRGSTDKLHVQWLRFLAVNLIGFVFNRGTYFALVASFASVEAHPVLAVAAGSIAGMFFNFFLSRRLVFR